MIFASDLDRTIIYSNKFINDDVKDHNIKNIEIYNNEEISFVTEEGIGKLKDISKKILFVPVTTRTIEQFNRIRFSEHLIDFKYVVTSNGGNIIVDGQVDKEYNLKVKKKIEDSYSIEAMVELFKKNIYSDTWVKKFRVADELFFYCVMEEDKAPMDEIMDFGREMVAPKDWNLVKNGRKLYMIPNCVSKGLALEEIARRTGEVEIVSSGDSIVDIEMLRASKTFIIPKHGELYGLDIKSDRIIRTENEGLLAGLEIIDYVYDNHIKAL